VMTLAFGVAAPLIKYFKEQGCIVLHKCTTIRHAKVCDVFPHSH